ncbi:VMAP-C domain-containing protein [Streptomyces bacillaris]|uniref:VMAP-C domain-containing protein n=1 Tax=Streptomyces bacillaris TaxID=68179 RepID=UPI0037028D2E
MTSVEDPAPRGGAHTTLRSRLKQWLTPRSAPPPAAAKAATAPATGPAAASCGPGAAAGWPDGAVDELCRALVGFSDFHQPEFVQLILVRMGGSLNPDRTPFSVAYHSHPHSQAFALVDAVDRHRDRDSALRALADALRFLRPDEAATVRLDEVVSRLSPAGRLPAGRLRAIVAHLDSLRTAIPLPVAGEALRGALLPSEPSGLRGSETVSGMVVRLNDAREFTACGADPAARPPLVLRFLAELAGELPATEQALLRHHVSLAAGELGLPARAVTDLAGRGRGCRTAAPDGHRVLQIRLRETAPGKQRYRVDAALFDRTETGLTQPRKREAQHPFNLAELRQFGRTCLADWSDLAARLDDADRVRVEFLLPWSLLGHPVEHWLTDGDTYLLGHKYPVVIRSLDRMERLSLRRDWVRRWKALHGTAGGQPFDGVAWLALDAAPMDALGDRVLRVRGRDGEVRAWLDAHPGATSFGLAFAYDPRTPQRALGLQEAVHEGVPLIVWRRDDGDPAELAGRLGEMTATQFSELPDHLRRWRRAAARDDRADMRNHLTLLWDDPECVRREGDLTAPHARPQAS